MKKDGTPLTRENYVQASGLEEPLGAEHEAALPKELIDRDQRPSGMKAFPESATVDWAVQNYPGLTREKAEAEIRAMGFGGAPVNNSEKP